MEPSLALRLSVARALLAGTVKADCGSRDVRKQVDLICALLADVETQLPTLATREYQERIALGRLLGVSIEPVPPGVAVSAQIVELRALVETRVDLAPGAHFDDFCAQAVSTLLEVLRADPR